MTERAFSEALRVFNRTRDSVVGCLRKAIKVYMEEAARDAADNHATSGLTMQMADTDDGKDTALVILGFKNAEEIQSFAQRVFSEKCR